MPNASIWLDRYRRRYEWAVHAYDSFVQELAPELVESLQRSEQVTIAVYGATQVGKTTLILDLLGLSTLTTDEVANVLRGGQQLGKSATAMPIRYGCSNDDGWYISGAGPLAADAAREKLAEFRRTVESGGIRDAEVLDIRIPQRLFPLPDKSNPPLALNIIDIPGINSRSEEERQLVAQLARRYVSVADLVLLVGRADSLGFLNEEDLQLKELADWSKQPTRFRIVLTFSFSPDSLCRQFMDKELTTERVRDVLIAEMSTHDYVFPPEFRQNLYVLELGDSMKVLARTNPDYSQRILNVTLNFRNELLNTITLAAGPYARLYGAFQLDRVINARVELLYQKLEQQDAAFNEMRVSIIQDLKTVVPDQANTSAETIPAEIEKSYREQSKLRQYQSELQSCIINLEKFAWASLFLTQLSNEVSEKVSSLKSELSRCEIAQRKACTNYTTQLIIAGKMPEWCADYLPVINYQRTHLMNIEMRLDAYDLDVYWFSSSYKKDRELLQGALHKGAKDLGDALKYSVMELLQAGIKSFKSAETDLKLKRNILIIFLEKLKKIEQEREATYSEYACQFEILEDSQHIASHFESTLNSAFLEELNKTRRESRSHPSVTQRFYGLLHTKLLLSEIDRMYEGRGF